MNYFLSVILLPLVLSKTLEKDVSLHTDNSLPSITLVTFDGEPTTTFGFKQMNDPVMVIFLEMKMIPLVDILLMSI